MPMPLSLTAMRTYFSSASTSSRSAPPSWVYLAALLRIFASTCTRRFLSPHASAGAGACVTLNCWRRACTSGPTCSTASKAIWPMSSGVSSSSTRPRVTRETSSRSSISAVMWRTWRPMIWLVLRTRFSFGSARSRRSAAAPIGASGLRSSCASMARNSSLRRSSSRSFSSAILRSVTSLAAPIHSSISPSSRNIGTARDRNQPGLPSTRRTRCSSSKMDLLRIASSMAACTSGWSSGGMYSCSQKLFASAVSFMKPRPSSWRISLQSGLMR
jgi:hypothetical protein